MAYSELTVLASDYPPGSQDALLELAERYRLRNEREILELAAIAADIAIDDIINLGLEPDSNPQLLDAWERHTNKAPESLVGETAEYLKKTVDALKGIYFEVLVKDRLNSGEHVGELKLDPGQAARLAKSTTEEGWDLQIFDESGKTVEKLQLKASKEMSYIERTLAEDNGYKVVVPEEIDSTSDAIIRTDIPLEEIEQTTKDQVKDWSESAIKNAVDHAAESAVDIIPIGSALVIVVIDGVRYVTGRATLKEAARNGGGRLIRSTLYSNLGTALATTGLGAAAIPAVMGVRLAERRLTGQINLRSNLEDRTADLELAFSRSHQEASA